jgi:hypothetical protein
MLTTYRHHKLIIDSKNNDNKNNKSSKSSKHLNSKNGSIELTLTYEKELLTILYDILMEYMKQQNNLNEFLQYDKRHIETFLEKITDIFHEAIRKSCIIHDTNKEGVENFLRNNWDELRFEELIRLIVSYVYDDSPLAVTTKTIGIKQFRKLRQELSKDIIDNWVDIVEYNHVASPP